MSSIPSDVLSDIRNQLNPLLKKVETSMIISTVKKIAAGLITLGQKHLLGVRYNRRKRTNELCRML